MSDATLAPPFAAIARPGGKFIALTEARVVSEIELALLRQAYEILLG
ncbi:MAG: hypothetical protein ACOY6N_06395 [Pseudomonadota bacterium]|nr:hypothetical protein [Rhodocyclaceae bacterium]